MGDITIGDMALTAFFLLNGFYTAFRFGGWLTKLAVLWVFCRKGKLQDFAWKLFTVSKMKHGTLMGKQSYTLNRKENFRSE
ncbi:hypothetical protein ACNZA9_003541 [Cronobacter sakazakii]